MAEILEELVRIEKCGDMSDEFLAVLRAVAETMKGLDDDKAVTDFPSQAKHDKDERLRRRLECKL
jgi:hypothetical protein